MRLLLQSALSLVVCLSSFAQVTPTATRLDGHRVAVLSPRAKMAVLFFVATDCPISNRYQPEILRLERKFTPQSVDFWFVYPNLTDTPASIRAHRADFAPIEGEAHVLLDPNLSLVKQTGATITPEAAIVVPGSGRTTLQTIYLGRIDDLYTSIGNSRTRATRHDLEDAVVATLKGQPVLPPSGPPVGCSIVSIR